MNKVHIRAIQNRPAPKFGISLCTAGNIRNVAGMEMELDIQSLIDIFLKK
ncbi:MAG: hypothetical protein HQK73_04275 [Desulfamplus sp.]|nr:hypothetical protein [Desulfamplus sp.]MBF0411824.1 hypothetical protein [Desulfamplus sp.]